ncbi:MAG: hypothetical protein U1C33_03770, partial [Candidatus Cloacimonadaceae bacterium]|nr:hypothetical protein [Candidatus Cloacimonadaceae bacterium]
MDNVIVSKSVPQSINWYSINGGTYVTGSIQGSADNNDVTVYFDATNLEIGHYNSAINVISNCLTNPMITIPVSMEVTTPSIPEISVSTAALDFGYILAGLEKTEQFSISNPGTALLSGSISAPAGFSITEASKSKTASPTRESASKRNRADQSFEIGAGQTLDFSVTFLPQEAGQYSGNLIISHNAGDDELVNVQGYGSLAVNAPMASGFEQNWGFWQAVTGTQANTWIRGTDTSATGNASIYISSDGVTNSFNPNSAAIVHFFADITFPAEMEATNLKFDWKAAGDSNDNLKVWLVESNISPFAGSALSGTQLGASYYNNGNAWSTVSIALSEALAGQTRRLVFSWTNDSAGGSQPPVAVDNIRIVQGSNSDASEVVTGSVIIFAPEVQDEESNPINVQVQISGLTGTIITVTSSYGDPNIELDNVGLSLLFGGAQFTDAEFTLQNLGFIPQHLAYRILPSSNWIFVPNPGDWTDALISIIIMSGGKAYDDLQIVFPNSGDSTLPVTLSAFTATLTAQNFVNLKWTTQSEANLTGYYLFRAETGILDEAEIVSPLIEAGNTSHEQHYTYTDSEVSSGKDYYYWLQSNEMSGMGMYHGPIFVSTEYSDGPEVPEIPIHTSLLNAYPNPFNPVTNIRDALKDAGAVQLEIDNLKGQMVRSF